jgi:hypothetical protein
MKDMDPDRKRIYSSKSSAGFIFAPFLEGLYVVIYHRL